MGGGEKTGVKGKEAFYGPILPFLSLSLSFFCMRARNVITLRIFRRFLSVKGSYAPINHPV